MDATFYVASGIAIVSTLLAITRTNAVHALLYLVVSLLSVALVFYVLGAPFVAALEVIIYAGAIVVLFIFVVMMLNLGKAAAKRERQWLHPGMWFGPGVLAALLLAELIWTFLISERHSVGMSVVESKQVGALLFGPYLLAVEIASMLLLAGLVGAYHLGRRMKKDRPAGQEPQ
jgi:NADH-quinone oxidoreductase subunit J